MNCLVIQETDEFTGVPSIDFRHLSKTDQPKIMQNEFTKSRFDISIGNGLRSIIDPQCSNYLEVPFIENDQAKKLGAMWHRQRKKWFVPTGYDLMKFAKWWPSDLKMEILFTLHAAQSH
jgi:hypothetical protein